MSMECLFKVTQTDHGSQQEEAKFAWDPSGRFLATCGANRRVHIWARSGEKLHEFSLGGAESCLDVKWDNDGEVVAVVQKNHTEVVLWNIHTEEKTTVETQLKEITFIAWSKEGSQLAIGSIKGNLLVYNYATKQQNQLWGKHAKSITCGAWSNKEDMLVLGSSDKTFTISDGKGETKEQVRVRGNPSCCRFISVKTKGSERKDQVVAVCVGGKTIVIYGVTEGKKIVELSFQKSYGNIKKIEPFGESYLLISFDGSKIIAISTDQEEIGVEVSNWSLGEGKYLSEFSGTTELNRIAAATANKVRFADMQNIKEWHEETNESIEFDGYSEGKPCSILWTRDGQILSVGTTSGMVANYLTSAPVLSASHGVLVTYLQSLRSVKIMNISESKLSMEIPIKVEPSFLAVSPTALAAGFNNHVWIYSANLRDEQKSQLLAEKEYLSTVSQIEMNSTHIAVLSQGKCYVDALPTSASSEGKVSSKVLPEDMKETVISISLTSSFLVYATESSVRHFFLEDWGSCTEYQHSEAKIVRVYPNATATRMVIVDSRQNAYVYNPISDTRVQIPKWPKAQKVIWDLADEGVFFAVDTKLQKIITTYVYNNESIEGPHVEQLAGNTSLPEGATVTAIHNGKYWGQSASGKILSDSLATHSAVNLVGFQRNGKEAKALREALALNRLPVAFELGLELKDNKLWKAVGKKALQMLDIDTAIRVYTKLANPAMVMTLRKLKEVEDMNLLKGHVCMLFHKFETAQRLFTNSKVRPITALEMRRDLLHWDQALKLAQQLAPDQIPSICREYAQQLEFKGEYDHALNMYHQAVDKSMDDFEMEEDSKTNPEAQAHKRVCRAGIARMTLRTGNLQQGLSMIRSNSNDKELIKSCGVILEAMAQHGEAAELYKMAGQYEKAATMYLRMKAFTKLEGLMDRITSPKLLAQYAKSMESQRRYKDAAAAYERAQDIDNVIRVCLKHLEAPQRAFELVRRTNSVQGASMVATYCMSNGDFELAIEFLLMANLDQQAFDRAKSHSKMDVYARALGDKATEEQYLRVAKFYENSSKKAEAGRYYARCDQHAKAMRLFLQCGEAEIPAAIDVVKQSRESPDSMMLVRMLHDYLVGETDGSPKDPKFIYQLFMAVGNHAQASKTAVVIATSEQEIGGYRTAHSILFETIKELRNNEVPIPNDLSRCLLLLHSYIIVRKLVQRGNHRDAARMLIRVSKNISKFPAHVVPILTSCVIECARGGLKKSAYEHATILMRPEHRPKIMQKVKRTIEKMVRRPPTKEEEEELSPCPFCFFKLPSTLLACPQCKNQLPYCVVTGRHMVASDYTHCPECKSPALYSQMVEIEAKGTPCYMCEKPIDKAKLKKLSREDVKVLLTATPGKKEERKQDSKESKGTVL